MTADVSRTTNYQDDHVASFPWEWLARIFASEIGFRTAGVGLERRVLNIDFTVAVKNIILPDVSRRRGRKLPVKNYKTISFRTAPKIQSLGGRRANNLTLLARNYT